MRDSDTYPANFREVCNAFTAALKEYAILATGLERRFDEDQPRIPAGQPGAGRWMETGAGDETGAGTGDGSGSAPGLSPAMARDWPGATQVAYQPPASNFTANLDAIQAAFSGFVTAELATKIITLPTLHELRRIPTGYDPAVGYPRFASRNIGPPSLTRPNGLYVEADGFQQLKDLFLKPEGLVFHHIVPQGLLGFFTDRPNNPRVMHNSDNIFLATELEHICMNKIYNSRYFPGVTNLQSLRGAPYREAYNYGLKVIRECTKDNIYEENVRTILDRLKDFGDFPSSFGAPPGVPPNPIPLPIPSIPF